MSLNEAVAYIGVSHWTLRNWVGKKIVPHYRFGQSFLFRKEQLDEWIKKHEHIPAEA